MKNLLILLGLVLLASPLQTAHAYSSKEGADPDRSGIGDGSSSNLGGDVETKAIKKSTTAGSSGALVAGLIVGYDQTAKDGYTVTRTITQNEVGLKTLACLTVDDVATGDTSYHRCITKGFVTARFDGSVAQKGVVAGRTACVDSSGLIRGCDTTNNMEATANTGITPLSSSTVTGTALPVLLNLR